MRYCNRVMVSKQKMLNTHIRPSDLSCLSHSSGLHSEECAFNLQMHTAGFLSPPAQLSVKKKREEERRYMQWVTTAKHLLFFQNQACSDLEKNCVQLDILLYVVYCSSSQPGISTYAPSLKLSNHKPQSAPQSIVHSLKASSQILLSLNSAVYNVTFGMYPYGRLGLWKNNPKVTFFKERI